MLIDDVVSQVRAELGTLNSPLSNFPDHGNLWAIVRALGSVAQDQFQATASTKQSMFIQYATGSDLDLHAANYGLTRLGGSTARGYVLISLTGSSNIAIPAGTVITIGGHCYTINTASTIYSNVEIPVACTSTNKGSIYNVAAGQAGSIAGYPNLSIVVGQYRTKGVAQVNIAGGIDAENDVVLRTRILSLFQRGAPSLQSLILDQVAGISRVNIVEPSSGGGYFWVYVDSNDYDTLNQVKTVVNQYRPIGIAAIVSSLQIVNYNFTLAVSLSTTTSVSTFESNANSTLSQYLASLAPGTSLSLTDLTLYIQGSISSDITISSGQAISLNANQGAALGKITFNITFK